MIELKNINKSYRSAKKDIIALSDISLSIPKGEIFGIIGHSGAGKSTLIRCLNLLERPSSGEIWLANTNLTQLNSSELMLMRRKIGMIFQHFNLLSSQTVFNNIAFPLKLEKRSQADITARVNHLLELTGLQDHAHKYPAQLSGGQKQRVGIARALSNEPIVLLCDEATSALDPQTTQSILELLVDINKELGLTIVLITHEMEVIRKICHQVAVINEGKIVEQGPVEEVFLHPQASVTREFILDTAHMEELKRYLSRHRTKEQNIYQITFSGTETFEPHLSSIIKATGVDFSILSGNISYIRDLPYGQLVVSLTGTQKIKEDVLHLFEEKEITTIELVI